MMGECETAH